VGLSLGVPPALHHLAYICRAITPANSPIRFDARFFLADAGNVSGSPVGSAELEDPQWLDMEAAQAANIARATRAVLGQLAAWLANPDPRGPVPVMRERAWLQE
jgi:8-oxo-dGTP pyrophosphatase MutT (NUDIX family)